MNYERVILELMERVSVLEEKMAELTAAKQPPAEINTSNTTEIPFEEDYYLKENPATGATRDTTKYLFEGKRYGKNRLVLAVIKRYVSNNPGISALKLMADFDRTIQGSLGVIRTASDAKYSYSDHARRFFFQPTEIIKTSTDDCVVCTQWGKFNIGNFITRAEQLGMHIQTIGGVSGNQIGYGEKMNSAFAMNQLIGQDTFMELYFPALESLHDDTSFMSFIESLRRKLDGAEIKNTRAANTEIMNAFFYGRINDQYAEVADIVEKVKKYGKQASAHISIYYAMYVLDFQ